MKQPRWWTDLVMHLPFKGGPNSDRRNQAGRLDWAGRTRQPLTHPPSVHEIQSYKLCNGAGCEQLLLRLLLCSVWAAASTDTASSSQLCLCLPVCPSPVWASANSSSWREKCAASLGLQRPLMAAGGGVSFKRHLKWVRGGCRYWETGLAFQHSCKVMSCGYYPKELKAAEISFLRRVVG